MPRPPLLGAVLGIAACTSSAALPRPVVRDRHIEVLVLTGGFDALECLPLEKAFGPIRIAADRTETLLGGGTGRPDIVLADCGIQWVKIPNPDLVGALRSFVEGGGRLMATDSAYPLIEAAWPDLIDFEGPGAQAGEPQRPEAASLGPEGDVAAEVIDEGLRRHLGTRRFTAERQQPDWAVMRAASADARVFVETTALGRRRPLAVAADFPGGGRVVYASFHGHTREAFAEACSPPKGDHTERALVYLVAYALAPAAADHPPRPVAARPPPPEPPRAPRSTIMEDADMEIRSEPAPKKPAPR